MHHALHCKGRFINVFRYLVEEKDYNPLRRDRFGRTAWGLAYLEATPRPDPKTSQPTHVRGFGSVTPDLIRKYAVNASKTLGSEDQKSKKIMGKELKPTDENRSSPEQFLENEDPFGLSKVHDNVARNAMDESGIIWLQLDENNVSGEIWDSNLQHPSVSRTHYLR
jgi:hypothetical protein